MGVSIRDEEQKNKNGDQLKKEKVGIKERELTSKLSELEKKYTSGDILDEEYEELKTQYVDQLKKLKNKPDEIMGKNTEDEENLQDRVEEELFQKILIEFTVYSLVVILIGYILSTINFYLALTISSFGAGLVGIRIFGLTVAWGMIHSNRYINW